MDWILELQNSRILEFQEYAIQNIVYNQKVGEKNLRKYEKFAEMINFWDSWILR